MLEAVDLNGRRTDIGWGIRGALAPAQRPLNWLRLRYGSLGSRSHAPSARITAQVLRVSARWGIQRHYLSPLAREHPCRSTHRSLPLIRNRPSFGAADDRKLTQRAAQP